MPRSVSPVQSANAARERKKYATSQQTRKKLKAEIRRKKHDLKPPCSDVCKRRCTQKLSHEQRCKVNEDFWQMNWYEQKLFIRNSCRYEKTGRSRTENSRRSKSIKYFFKNESTTVSVCKQFFLSVLGFKKTNDSVAYQALSSVSNDIISPKADGRGRKPSKNKIERSRIRCHIDSFHPCVSHYRREHAPNALYLPSDISVQSMYDDFVLKHGKVCSYELYRKVVKEMRISFTKLGHEECEMCEHFQLHNKSHGKDNLDELCYCV